MHVLLSLMRASQDDWKLEAHEVNGEPAITVHRADGTIDTAFILHPEDGRIDAVRNPEKLRSVARP